MKPTISERFWAKVNIGKETECWPWTGYKMPPLGYAMFSYNRRPAVAHRVAFFLTHGRWPFHYISLSCGNCACCNPSHFIDRPRRKNPIRIPKPPVVYDWKFILSNIEIDAATGCWHWTKAKDRRGYGLVSKRSCGFGRAHRLSFFLWFGPVGPACVCHHCDNRICVNPDHLFLGTKGDNNRDATEKGRRSKGEHHPKAKLTNADVYAIRASTENHSQTAAKFGVSHSIVSGIRKRQIWKHLP